MPKKTKGSTMGFTLINGLVMQIKGSITSEMKNGSTFAISFPTIQSPGLEQFVDNMIPGC
ncbi:MAG: hypothetical protein WD267_03870 [Balneolales bacterium]